MIRKMKTGLAIAAFSLLAGTLACNISTSTPSSAPGMATDTPELVLPPPVMAVPRLAYIKSGNVWIWTEGSGSLQLTSSGDSAAPTLASDGQLVAYLRAGQLWVVNADGSGERALVDTAYLAALAASPDDRVEVDQMLWFPGTHILAFTTLDVSGMAGFRSPRLDLNRVDTEENPTLVIPLQSPGNGGVPYLSPDGNALALAQSDQIIFVASDGSSAWRIAMSFASAMTYSEWSYIPRLVWLPDSSAVRVVVSAHDALGDPAEASTFWDLPISGPPAALTTFVSVPVFASFPFVSPDGSTVAYLADSASTTDIHTITAAGVDTLALSYPPNTVRLLGWHPDSLHFLFSQPEPIDSNLGSTGSAVPLGDTARVQQVTWLDYSSFFYLNDQELRVAELGSPSSLIDTAVSDYDLGRVVY